MRRFCELELLASRAYRALRESELTNKEGESKRLLDDYRRLVALQIVVARELGLSPAARMAIKASSTTAALDLVGQLAANQQSERIESKPAIDEGETK